MKWALVFLLLDVNQIYETGLEYRDLESCRMVAAQLRNDAIKRFAKIEDESRDAANPKAYIAEQREYDVLLQMHLNTAMVCIPTK